MAGTAALGLFRKLRTRPVRNRPRTSRRGQGRAQPRSYVPGISQTSSTSSLITCDLVSQCPLYPGDCGARTAGRSSPAAARRLAAARPCTPVQQPTTGGFLSRGIIKGSRSFTRPAFPSPVAPGWNGSPRAFPRASHPAVTGSACRGGDRHLGHLPELRHHQLVLQSTQPLTACDLVSH
jgi:hypothetical protein